MHYLKTILNSLYVSLKGSGHFSYNFISMEKLMTIEDVEMKYERNVEEKARLKLF